MGNRRDFLKKGLLSSLLFSPSFQLLRSAPNFIKETNLSHDLGSLEGFYYDRYKAYLNTASLGLSPKIVVDNMTQSMVELEMKGRDGRWYFDECREKIATFLNAQADEIAITRNATEGMNIMAHAIDLQEGDEVILSTHEHIGGSAPWLAMQKEKGVKVVLVDLDLSGENNLERIKAATTSKTKVISFSHLLCTTGMVLPAKEIVSFCRENDIYSCVDGAQAVGAIKVDLKEIGPDFYAASGHKWLFGPKGTGILFINEKVIDRCKPAFAGAYTDSSFDLLNKQMEYRSVAAREEYGTRNATLVLGLSTAVDLITELGVDVLNKHGKELNDRLRNALNEINDVQVLSPSNALYTSPIFTFRIEGINNQELVKALRSEHQLVIRHIYENNLDAIRVSSAFYNNPKDIDRLVASLKSVLSNE